MTEVYQITKTTASDDGDFCLLEEPPNTVTLPSYHTVKTTTAPSVLISAHTYHGESRGHHPSYHVPFAYPTVLAFREQQHQ